MKFGRKILEGYLAVVLTILVIVGFIVLSGIGMQISTEFILLDIILIILVGVNLLIAVLLLRILEKVEAQKADD